MVGLGYFKCEDTIYNNNKNRSNSLVCFILCNCECSEIIRATVKASHQNDSEKYKIMKPIMNDNLLIFFSDKL